MTNRKRPRSASKRVRFVEGPVVDDRELRAAEAAFRANAARVLAGVTYRGHKDRRYS